jgi:hypothetical protein
MNPAQPQTDSVPIQSYPPNAVPAQPGTDTSAPIQPSSADPVPMQPTTGGNLKRRRRTVKRGNNRGECCEATYHGLHVWFKHMFEHLGWMLLAKKRGHMDKVQVYKQSLLRLKTDLEQRMKYMRDADRKQDLKIMLSDLAVLIEHTNKDFP